jgi:hypothetical protein
LKMRRFMNVVAFWSVCGVPMRISESLDSRFIMWESERKIHVASVCPKQDARRRGGSFGTGYLYLGRPN